MNGKNENIIQIDVLLAARINPKMAIFILGNGVSFFFSLTNVTTGIIY